MGDQFRVHTLDLHVHATVKTDHILRICAHSITILFHLHSWQTYETLIAINKLTPGDHLIDKEYNYIRSFAL